MRSADNAIQTNVIRQFMYSPMTRSSGSPTIMAMEVPVTIIPSAALLFPSGAVRTASGEAIP
nr:hypothetical protein [Phocaeicola dorei]